MVFLPHIYYILVGGLERFLFFHIIGNNNPNWLIFFKGVETTNQYMSIWYVSLPYRGKYLDASTFEKNWMQMEHT